MARLGRPRKPNRQYSGPITFAEIQDYSRHVHQLDGLLSGLVERMRAAELDEIHVFGREIVPGTAKLDGWLAKAEAAVNLAIRRKSLGGNGTL